MPREDAALYSRGKYRLEHDRRSDGTLRSRFYQVVWYDRDARRNRSRSTGETEIGRAEDALDRLFLERERGQTVCPSCGRAMEHPSGYLLTAAIADYLLTKEDVVSIQSIRPRLGHVLDYLEATDQAASLTCERVDENWVAAFRKWSARQPVAEGTKNRKVRDRAPGTTEASVRSLAAAINLAHQRNDAPFRATFAALPPSSVSRTPQFRASIDQLAAMFRYCIDPQAPQGQVWSDKFRERQKLHRRYLLRFLQVSVATWCRPDAAHDFSTALERDQWISAVRVAQLNPKGRRQTKKFRPAVTVPQRIAILFDACKGFYIPVRSVRKAFEAMANKLGLCRAIAKPASS